MAAAVAPPAARAAASGEPAAAAARGTSRAARFFLTASWIFSKALTSICRTRSRETPNSVESSSSVIGSSASRRASKMRRSRGLRTESASRSAASRFWPSCSATTIVSWLAEVVDEPVLPLALALLAQRRVERDVAAEPAVHVDDVLLGDAEPRRDLLHLVGAQIALVERRDAALRLAQVEEQLLLVRGGAHLHERPRAQDVFLDRRLDPPHGVGGEPEALVGLEALDGLHQADIALGHDLADRQAVAAIAHGDLGDETQMRGHEPVRGGASRHARASAWRACTPRSARASGTCGSRRGSGTGPLRWRAPATLTMPSFSSFGPLPRGEPRATPSWPAADAAHICGSSLAE